MAIILNGSTGITTPGLDGNAVGTDVQPVDSDLTALGLSEEQLDQLFIEASGL